jgi:hypothetical protein
MSLLPKQRNDAMRLANYVMKEVNNHATGYTGCNGIAMIPPQIILTGTEHPGSEGSETGHGDSTAASGS